jgi:hypothetical protein
VVAPSAPSAPCDEPDEDLYNADDVTPRLPPDVPNLLSQHGTSSEQLPAPSAPTLEELTINTEGGASDDKQELERQRLLAEVSAPSDLVADGDDNGGEGSSRVQHEPSAPILTEDDEYGGQYSHQALPSSAVHHEALPKYER